MSDMHASQRGSVLLTVIAGILILGVVGAAALSLMTGSVMTVVDGRETVQAAYLAESGKEIVRAQTESKSGGALMEAAISLTDSWKENEKKGLAVDGTGFVKMELYPSWFRWYKGEGNKEFHLSTSLEWPYLPNKEEKYPPGELDWLAISQKAVRYIGDINSLKFGDEPADIYLIGKVTGTPSYNDEKHTLSVTPADNSFQYFPEYGGLIGFVARRQTEKGKTEDGKAEDGDPQATSVSDIRFLYDRMKEQKGKYTFYNVTVSPQGTSTTAIEDVLANSDVALGQYFRVVCESVTNYGARSALVWHTNGRNSLRYYADNGGGEDGVVGGNNADDLLDVFGGKVENDEDDEDDEDEGLVKGDNIMGNLQKDDDELEWDFDDDDDDEGGNINGANKDKIEDNHFLKRDGTGGNHEYWWVAVASSWLPYDSGKGVLPESMIQYSFKPDDEDENYFTGILCRLAFVVNGDGGLSGVGTVLQRVRGAKGIGVGVMQGEITFHKNEVETASVNPALLPGFSYNNQKKFIISTEKREELYGVEKKPGTLGKVVKKENKIYTRLYPLLVVWAYDDTKSGKGNTKNNKAEVELQTLKPLAIAVLDREEDYLKVEDYLSLTVEVKEEGGKNHLTVWLQEEDDDFIKGESTEDGFTPQFPGPGKNLVNGWDYMAKGVSSATDNSLSTSFAVGEAYLRVGIFSEAYDPHHNKSNHTDIKIGNFFFTGTGSGGGSLFPGGLTPGIVN